MTYKNLTNLNVASEPSDKCLTRINRGRVRYVEYEGRHNP